MSLCNPRDCSTPGFPVFHNLPEFAQTQVHWVGNAISSSVTPFSSGPQSFPATGSFPMSQFFASGTKVLELQLQHQSFQWIYRFPLWLTDLISLLSQGLPRVLSSTKIQRHQFFFMVLFMVQLSHPYITTGKAIALTIQTFVSKMISLIFNSLSRFVIAFLPRSKCLLTCCCSRCPKWFWSPRKLNLSVFPLFFLTSLPWSYGTWLHDFSFSNVKFQTSFYTPQEAL